MNRHHHAPTSMHVLLVVSLLLAFVISEQGTRPPVAQAATPVSISAGYAHTCGMKADGTLICWGAKGYGRATPRAGSFTQVSAGGFHTCGLKSDGTLACWGDNSKGQATPPAGSFSRVSAGYYYSCGMKADGTLACWGDNSKGQATPPAGSFTQISAGDSHTCGVKNDGTLVCWGDNDFGQATPPAGTFTQVGVGEWHTCGLKGDSTLACWGDNSLGQATPPAGTFTQISVGYNHSCGLKSDGTGVCWGDNSKGQATPPAGSFAQISAGWGHTCGLKSNGTGVCWGDNSSRQTLSQVSISPANVPAVKRGTVPLALSGAGGIGGPYTFTVFSGTLPTGLSLNSDGTWTWNNPAGAGDYSFDIKAIDQGGILGVVQHFTLRVLNTIAAITNDTPEPSTVGQNVQLQYAVTPLDPGTPTGTVTVAVAQEALRLIQVSAGDSHTCGVKADSTLSCWGDNRYGQVTPPGGSFSQVSAGWYHACGVKADGTLTCWGDNANGKATPPGGSFSQVSAGENHTCGLKSDGTLACWGNNANGQATPPAGSFSQVSVGRAHTCGVQSDGTAVCWGNNDDGRATPPAGSFSQVSAGDAHTCGLKSDGSLACWGDNSLRQAAPSAGAFTQVSAGYAYTCGLKSDGSLACWGYDGYGRATPPAGIFTQIGAGSLHGCGVKADSTLACWGYNDNGQAAPPRTTIDNSTETCTASVSAGGCAVQFSSIGLKYLKASYAGAGAFTESESALIAHSVRAATTTTISSITPGPASAGPTVLVRYTVATAEQEQPGGLVTVRAGTDTCTAPATAGVCRLTFTSGGVKSITATYAGDSAFHGSVSSAAAYTAMVVTTTSITSIMPDPAGAERTVLVRYSVASAEQAQPGGMVAVQSGTDSCTASVAAGVCRLTFSSLGAKSLTATYAGDNVYYGSVSAAATYTAKAATTTSITSITPDPAGAERTVLVRYTVASAEQAQPSGMVMVRAGADSCTASATAGVCRLTFTSAGVKSVTATYAGDSAFFGSVSAAVAYTVTGGAGADKVLVFLPLIRR